MSPTHRPLARWREQRELELASSAEDPAPEYRMSVHLVQESDDDGASVRLIVRWPFGGEHVFLDAHQVETLHRLLGEALPSLRQAESAADEGPP